MNSPKASPIVRLLSPLFATAILLAPQTGHAYADAVPKLTLSPDHADGVYAPKETATWTVDAEGDRTALKDLPYTVTKDGNGEVCSGTLDLSAGPVKISAFREEPGALLAEIKSSGTAQKTLGLGGVVFAPDQLGPVKPAPADFDAFWQEKLKELSAVAPNPQVEKISVEVTKYLEGIDLYRVTLDNIRGTHVRGLLARPAQGEKFPALLMVNYAGVYPLSKTSVLYQAKPGWLVLNVNAHDIPVDESPAYYKEQLAGPLKGYTQIGNDSRETSYFLRMFLGCVRGAEYLASRPDWDGRVMVVTGASQGGLQSFATAALYPKITAVMAVVPAGCDVYGPQANPPRALSWPSWLAPWSTKGRDPKKVEETAGYFDGIYFAERVRCPTLIGVALGDNCARPAGVIAAYNAITQPKELVIMPMADHGSSGTQLDYVNQAGKWKEALQKGNPLAIPAGK